MRRGNEEDEKNVYEKSYGNEIDEEMGGDKEEGE